MPIASTLQDTTTRFYAQRSSRNKNQETLLYLDDYRSYLNKNTMPEKKATQLNESGNKRNTY
jgi:hypothetical protein